MKKYQSGNENKYEEDYFTFVSPKTNESIPELNSIETEISYCEQISRSIYNEYSSIDKSIQKYRENYRAASDTLWKWGDNLSLGIDEKNIEKHTTLAAASVAINTVGLLVRLGGAISAGVKDYQASKKKKEAEDILLEKKKEIADSKLDETIQLRDEILNGAALKVRELFDKEANKKYDPESGEYQIKIFKRLYSILERYDKVVDSMDYLVSEMKAWQNGSHNSKSTERSPSLLSGFDWWNNKDTNKFLLKDSVLTTKAVVVLSDPTLTKNYIGINQTCYPCDSALIQMVNGKVHVSNPKAQVLLESNPYVKDCEKDAKLLGTFKPSEVHKSALDYIVMGASFLVPFIVIMLLYIVITSPSCRILISGLLIWRIIRETITYKSNHEILPNYQYPYDKACDKEEQRYKDHLLKVYKRHHKTSEKYQTVEL